MEKYKTNGSDYQLADYETPFADIQPQREEEQQPELEQYSFSMLNEIVDSPFKQTYETTAAGEPSSTPVSEAYTELLAELNDPDFENIFYNLAAEAESTYLPKISSETAMGESYVPFITQQINEYLLPLTTETERMIDRVKEHFSGNNLADLNEAEVEMFFEQLEGEHPGLTPIQEQFLGSIVNKVRSVVNTGIKLAKKGIAAVGKILPLNIILGRLRGFVRPIVNRVVQFAKNKLPKQFQPYVDTLAKNLMKLETSHTLTNSGAASANLEAVQYELDTNIARLVFSGDETETSDIVQNYLTSLETFEQEVKYETGGLNIPAMDSAKTQLITELKNLRPGESPAPAIENFLPAALLAAQPIIKMAIGIIGRPRVIDFLAGLLAQLVAKFIPKEVAKPLASQIIDVGMGLIGFETNESGRTDLAYEAIANTIEETVRNLGGLDEAMLENQEMFTAAVLEAFEKAVPDNFPSAYVKENFVRVKRPGVWVLMPRSGPKHLYKKFTHVFPVTINPAAMNSVTSFNGVPLSGFLRDKLGLDTSKSIQARVHLYEAIEGTWLSRISMSEKVPGLGDPYSWVQIHPLTKKTASVLLMEPELGKDVEPKWLQSRHKIQVGQRFFYLEINGARMKRPVVSRKKKSADKGAFPGKVSPGAPEPGRTVIPESSDIQGVINFIKSEIRLNYFFSEEDAKSIVEKLNRNDYLGAALSLRYSVRNVLNDLLIKNVGSKVKLVHEAVPEMYLENTREEQFAPLAALGSIAVSAGKEVLVKLVQKLIEKISEMAYQALVNYFKARAAEFKQFQAEPADGVTVKIIWINIPGMSAIRAVINAVKGNLSVGNLADLVLPNIPTPEVKISAGKNFD